MAITASPISAAVIFLSGVLEKQGVGYLELLAICIPSSFLACIAAAFVANFLGKDLKDDPVYQERLAKGLVQMRGASKVEIKPGAKLSVGIFLIAILAVVAYATMISPKVGWIPKPIVPRTEAIILFMFAAATLITFFTRIDAANVLNSSTFKSGMSACICVLGVAWLGDTFVANHIEQIKSLAGDLLNVYPWLLAVVLFFASTLLYSQAATTRALIPAALLLGVSPLTVVASFAAVSALFILPTYPTLIAAVEMDDTGSTRIGKYVFNHPFLIPGAVAIALSVIFAFAIGGMII